MNFFNSGCGFDILISNPLLNINDKKYSKSQEHTYFENSNEPLYQIN